MNLEAPVSVISVSSRPEPISNTIHAIGSRLVGKGDNDLEASRDSRFRLNGASMGLGNRRHDRKANAVAPSPTSAIHSVAPKRLEQHRYDLRCDDRAAIANMES